MDFFGSIYNTVFYAPIVNLLVVIMGGLDGFGVKGSLGLAIIFLTILMRLAVWPLLSTQLKSAKKMSELKPKIDELKERHGSDKQAMALAQAQLFKEHGVNPASGCLPVLIQGLMVSAVYQLVPRLFNPQEAVNHLNYFLYPFIGKLSFVPDPHFLGVNLGIKPADFMGQGWWLLLVPVLTAVLTLMQSKMMVPAGVKVYPSDSTKEKKEKEGMEESMAAVQSQMTFLMPAMIGYFAFIFPIGVSLCWNIFTILSIYQQYLTAGWGGMATWLNRVGLGTKKV